MLVSRWVLMGAVASIILLASLTGLVYLQLSSRVSSLQSQVSSLQNQMNHYVLSQDVCDKLGNGDCFKELSSLVVENPRFIQAENGTSYAYEGSGSETSSIVNGSVVRTISLMFSSGQTNTTLYAVIPLGGGITGYGGYYDIADMTFFFSPSSVTQVPASPVSIGVEGSFMNYTTFSYGNGSLSFPSSDEFPLSVSAQSVTDVHLAVVGAVDGVWAKLMPENLTSVGPRGASSVLVVAGAVSPSGGGKPSNGFTISVVASDDAGHSSVANIELIPEVHVAVLRSSSSIDLVHIPDMPFAANPNFLQVAPYGAVYDPLASGAAENLSVSFGLFGILLNGSVQALPPWLQVITPEASFNLTGGVPHYFELGVNLVSAPLGNFTIAVNETIGGMNFTAYVDYTVFPQPYTPIG